LELACPALPGRSSGPKDYRDARCLALLDAILSGEDTGYEPGGYPDEENAVLDRLGQTTVAASPVASPSLNG
jgi:hypothetical protein